MKTSSHKKTPMGASKIPEFPKSCQKISLFWYFLALDHHGYKIIPDRSNKCSPWEMLHSKYEGNSRDVWVFPSTKDSPCWFKQTAFTSVILHQQSKKEILWISLMLCKGHFHLHLWPRSPFLCSYIIFYFLLQNSFALRLVRLAYSLQ